jgi:uncharacterized phiE125 gp8 family phage protein
MSYIDSLKERTTLEPILVTDATLEPVTTEQAKDHLRVDGSDEDDYIAALITAARTQCETVLNRSFITTTWKVTLDRFPGPRGEIRLPRPRLISVTGITYNDYSGASQTLSSLLYTVDTQHEPGRIVPAYTQIWPSTRCHVNDVAITYTAGYGATQASVPTQIKQAILLTVAHLFELRTPVSAGIGVNEIPMSAQWLLNSCRWTPL